MSLYLKWTRKGRVPSHQGGDPIPYRKWTPTVDQPVLCERGWHACRWEDALHHVSDVLWVCELRGTIMEGSDKVAASSLRLTHRVPIGERELRLFAADCAERVLPIFERRYPRRAIEVARLFAEGQATADELAAARAAARAAAIGVARTVAWSAADAAEAAAWAATDAARVAAIGAARGAAAAAAAAGEAAAGGAAWGAAGGAERTWQTDRLLVHYGGLDPADFAHRGAS